MNIEYLSDHMAYAEDFANKIYLEFIKDIRHGISYEQVLAKVTNCHKTKLPIRLIALEDGKCVGTVAIVENDLKCTDYTPWLASLYVDPAHRGQKIAQRLIERVKSIVKDLGYTELYLRTEHTSDYYRRLGWEYVESHVDEFGLEPDVFQIALV